MDITLKSVFRVSKAIIPTMLGQSDGGRIVNISSINGQCGLGEEAYSAAKAGVINLTRNLAVRYGQNRIRVNCVTPGTIATQAFDARSKVDPTILDKLRAYYPLGRVGRAEDIANAVWFLSSDQAEWITGVTLNVDGGLLAGIRGLQRDLVPQTK